MSNSLKAKMETLSFCEANSPVYFISKLLGQVPYSIVECGKHKALTRFTVANILFALACYGFYCVTLYFFINDSLGHFMHIVIGFVTSMVCFLFAFIKAHRLAAFISELHKIDDELFGLCDRVRINYKKSFVFQLKLILASIVLFCLVGGFDYFVFQGLYGSMSIMVVVSYIIPYMFSSCSAGQFIVGVHLIYERFILINKFLSNIADTNEPTSVAVKMHRALFDDDDGEARKVKAATASSEAFSISRNLIQRKHEMLGANNMEINKMFDGKTKPEVFESSSVAASVGNKGASKFNQFSTTTVESTKYNLERKPAKLHNHSDGSAQSFYDFFKSIFRCNSSKRKINERIESDYPLNLHLRMNEIFSLHDKLSDIAENLNDLYSTEMVIFITGGFVTALFGVFFETKVIFWQQELNQQLLLIASTYVLWGVLVSTVIYAVLRVCSNTRDESCESALIIHKILQNKPAFMLNDETFYGKMKAFTLQILHRKKVFHFNGLGLFKLDYTFIFSAVSAATSYLIVLLQFDMSDDFNNFRNFLAKANANSTAA